MRMTTCALAFAMAIPATAQEPHAPLAGEWAVDLRPSLDDKPYYQPMVLAIDSEGKVSGTFYNTQIETGLLGIGQGRSCVFFRTSDKSGAYHTAACLVDGRMVGQTWSEGRGFVLPWTAGRP